MTHFITVNGLTLHCQLEGVQDGSPLVFINSLGTDLRIWDEVTPHFADRYRLIRYDKRGHGLSDCPPAPYSIRDHATDLASLLDNQNLQQVVLIGISVGGMIALDFAATWPQRVQKLVLCDTAATIGTPDTWNERIHALNEHGMDYLSKIISTIWFTSSFAEQSQAAYHGFTNMLTRTPLEGYIGTCEAIRDADLAESTQTIQVPTLVLCGKEDRATPPKLVRSLLGLLPHVSYQEISGAAHLPCIEQPGVMADHIDEFL
jgi:3-oxoadipate enol-lactonase